MHCSRESQRASGHLLRPPGPLGGRPTTNRPSRSPSSLPEGTARGRRSRAAPHGATHTQPAAASCHTAPAQPPAPRLAGLPPYARSMPQPCHNQLYSRGMLCAGRGGRGGGVHSPRPCRQLHTPVDGAARSAMLPRAPPIKRLTSATRHAPCMPGKVLALEAV